MSTKIGNSEEWVVFFRIFVSELVLKRLKDLVFVIGEIRKLANELFGAYISLGR